MPYLWKTDPSRDGGVYISIDHKNSPTSLIEFQDARRPGDLKKAVRLIAMDASIRDLSKLDCIYVPSVGPILTPSAAELVASHCGSFPPIPTPVEVVCADGVSNDFYALIIPYLCDCLDMDRSDCLIVHDAIIATYDFVFLPDCLGRLHIARERQLRSHIVVSDQLACNREIRRLKGVYFAANVIY